MKYAFLRHITSTAPTMRNASLAPARSQRGFTLIEVLVAVAIMAMGLALLYQILGTNTRAVGQTGQYQRATMLMQSLLNMHDGIPEGGWNDQGQSAGLHWQVRSRPFPTATQSQIPSSVPVHELDIAVQWSDNGSPRNMTVTTLRPQRLLPQGTSNGNSEQ